MGRKVFGLAGGNSREVEFAEKIDEQGCICLNSFNAECIQYLFKTIFID